MLELEGTISLSHYALLDGFDPWRLTPLMHKLCCVVKLHFDRVGHLKQLWDYANYTSELLGLDRFLLREIHKLTPLHRLSHRERKYLKGMATDKLFHIDPLYYSTYTKKSQ